MVGLISLTFAHLPFFVAFFHICHLPWKIGKSTLRFVLNLKLAICRVGWSTPIFCRFSNQQQKALSVLLLPPACSLSTLTISTGKYLLSIFMKILVVNFPEWYSWKFSSSLPWQFWSDGAESEQTTYLGDGHQIVSPSFLFIYFWFLASQDALEVMFLSELLTLRTKLTDVTLVSEDTYWGLYWQDSGNLWCLLVTMNMCDTGQHSQLLQTKL